MKNSYGFDVRPGQVWTLPRHGVDGVVKRIYQFGRGHCVEISHPAVWGHTTTHLPLSELRGKPGSKALPWLKTDVSTQNSTENP